MSIGSAIRYYRVKMYPMRGGQTEFAAALGTTRQEVSAWENGKRVPTLKNLRKIADVLGVSINDLTTFAGKNEAPGMLRGEDDAEYWRDLAISYKERISDHIKRITELEEENEELRTAMHLGRGEQ